ncbi:metal ABC transporter permease [Alicyclobacillus tolerans]|uniref:Zinc/manganese transport system permease protein n=2 Tax=Alicyclobacillus tolerans TaxID=90970 RepID=A0A1M6PNB8_9BACL|nr:MULTISPECIES: metal ABC transporter permease [Alicyclobacillus]MDP9729263.1 zinc/manganese transport system permease protein [Alicyclobacillus tengchongensis]SHK09459.1 zinc/manganese transport system permease protein [Alicyclobacillus montanus]
MWSVWHFLFAPGVFRDPFMLSTWEGASIVAVLAGMIGFFVILRGTAFASHALPKGGFAGAAAAALLGINTLWGLTVFSVSGALAIGWLGRRGRHDVVIALILVFLLGSGALFLNLSDMYAPEIYSLLFGEILGITPAEVRDTAIIGLVSIIILLLVYRPLLYVSVLPESAQARGLSVRRMEMVFLFLVGLTSAVTVPIVGALLTFSLMVAPAAAASYLAKRPGMAMILSVVISLASVWLSILLSFDTGWPVGFFVASLSAFAYFLARFATARRRAIFPKAHRQPAEM